MFEQSPPEKMSHSQIKIPPLIKELSEKCKESLDTIQKLQDMEVLCEKALCPKIIVLSEASAGASVIIGALIGLNLPDGLGFPVVLKFRTESDLPYSKIWLEFLRENSYCEKEVAETSLVHEISKLVAPVPEDERSSIEITLNVIQPQVSDLTIILLPEIHTHLDIYEEKREMELFKGYIARYTGYNECLFLNVLACSSDFNSCLSRKILKRIDYNGTQTITVFNRVDLSCECMITQLTNKIFETPTPFGFFIIDNAIEDDEKSKECGLLSDVKEYIGFDVISKNIAIAMWSILFNPSYLILSRIESDLEKCNVEIEQCQKTFDSVSDAIPSIESIILLASTSLHNLFIDRDYGEYLLEKYMHTAANMALQFRRFRTDLHELKLDNDTPFLEYEIELLVSKNCPNPTNLVSSSIIKPLLKRQFSYASSTIDNFVSRIMDYISDVVVKVLLDHGKNNLQLYQFLIKIGGLLVEGVRNSFDKKLQEMLDMEKKFIYTCSDDFSRKLNEMKSVKLELDGGQKFTSVEGLGEYIRVDHLKSYPANQIETAFELKKLTVVYWEFVVNRFVDYCALNIQSSINQMMPIWIKEVMREHVITRFEDKSKLPDVEPIAARYKVNLERRIGYLKEIKKDIEKWQVELDFNFKYFD